MAACTERGYELHAAYVLTCVRTFLLTCVLTHLRTYMYVRTLQVASSAPASYFNETLDFVDEPLDYEISADPIADPKVSKEVSKYVRANVCTHLLILTC